MTDSEARQNEYHDHFAFAIKTWSTVRQSRDSDLLNQFSLCTQHFLNWAKENGFQSLMDVLSSVAKVTPEQSESLDNTAIGKIDVLLNKLIVASKQVKNPLLCREPRSESTSPTIRHQSNRIAIIDDSELARLSTKAMLDRFNFDVDSFASIDEFKQNVNDFTDIDVVLLDVVMPDITEEILFAFAAELRQQNVNIILVSGSDSIELRIKAVRADIGGYVVKPFDINVLVSNIRWICNLDVSRPFRVILLDDQKAIGQYLGSYAKSLGFELIFHTSATSFFEGLDVGVPDLFLLDINLPNISGMEVCKILRQQKRFDYVPIVFLSTDDSLNTKLEALSAGADDIIIKHNPPDVIFKQVEKRIIRGQRVRSMAVKDSLTGLLNHGQMMEAAASAFRLAKRNNQNITVAMIDLDNFKQVNDTYGHMIGDNVIVGLAQLLKTSVRESDVVGRYGGEEFIIIFHSEELGSIEKKLNAIRQTFSELRFSSGDGIFKCTFSCGVATALANETFKDVINRADQMMYDVKRENKNAVKVAS